MPFLQDHTLFTAHGNLPGGEQWSCGIRHTVQPDQAGLEADTAIAAAAWKTFVTAMGNATTGGGWGQFTTLEGVTGRVVNPAGVTVRQAEGIPIGGSVTTALATTLPNQCACVVSLITGRPGRTGKGRIYLPLFALSVAPNTNRHSKATNIAGHVKTLLDSINSGIVGAGGTGTYCIVASQVGAGALSKIVSVRVGDVIDTQRRRRDSLVENYTSSVLA